MSDSDGCTMPRFLKGVMKAYKFKPCCEQHDFDRRDDSIKNKVADRTLRRCIAKKGHPVRAWIYWIFVRLANPFYSN